MQEIKQQLKNILETQDWTAEDRSWLLQYLETNDTTELMQLMQQEFAANSNGRLMNNQKAKYLLEQLHLKLQPGTAKIVHTNWWKRVSVAAVIILFIGAGINYFVKNNGQKNIAKPNDTIVATNDVPPGGNKATLTLADNTTIVLDNAQNGTLAKQGAVTVIKLNDGQISYKGNGNDKLMYNTITTPRGGQYQLILADGSKVWLNAASSLKFPNAFPGNVRKVELTGEGYFEVAHDASKPFHVITGKMDVQVLGTHFNVNAYSDEDEIKTTLLQGSVMVNEGQEKLLIKPGEQAVLGKNGIKLNRDVNLEETIAWKNGSFQFNNTGMAMVMRQISRWYDVEVNYPNGIPNDKYWGSILRNQNLSDVLKVLKESGAQFKIEGKKIIVTP
mgnify:CR=1 FL=1